MRSVRATIVALEIQWILHNLSVFRYPTWNAHAPICLLCCAPFYNIFPHYLIEVKIFEKKKKWSYWTQNVNCDFIYKFFWTIFHSKKEWARYCKKIYIGLHVKYRLFLSDFNEFWIFSIVFKKKIHKYKFSWKSVHWEPSCSMRKDGRTDGQTWRI